MTPGACLGLARQIVPRKQTGNKEDWGLGPLGLATEDVVARFTALAICLGVCYRGARESKGR